jgi:nitroreductase
MKKIILCLTTIPSLIFSQTVPFGVLTLKRYSPYEFDPFKEITNHEIGIIADAVRNSPSSFNQQPWIYILCDKKQNPEAYANIFSCLAEKNKEWAKDAPLLILCLANLISDYDNNPNPYAEYDTGCASVTLSYSATSIGAQAHQIGGFDADKAKALFNIPARYKPMTVIALGFAKNNKAPPKVRKPIDEIFFVGSLDQGFVPDSQVLSPSFFFYR